MGMGIYPNCRCGGFEGAKESGGDARMCIDKYCQDPKTPCPTDNFVICVKENTKVATLLQWNALIQNFDSSFGVHKQSPSMIQQSKGSVEACQAADLQLRGEI